MKTGEIANFLGAELSGDPSVEISGVASLDRASTGHLAFIEDAGAPADTRASCLIAPSDFPLRPHLPTIRTKNPKLAFTLAANALLAHRQPFTGSDNAVIADSAKVNTDRIGSFVTIGENTSIADGVEIADGVRIGRGVTVGRNTLIHPNCTIYDGVEVGEGCILYAGVVIGADGFGYVRDDDGEYHQFPQIGKVIIEDRVEIGANTCIDRGSLGDTRIGAGTKIDNLVQIGHNVQIGKRVVIAAQTGISGSTVIEDDCVIGGQVGMGDHARVLSGAVIGSQAGVLPGKIVREGVWWGTPVQPLDEFKRQHARVKGLERLKAEVKELKRQLSALTKRQ